VTAAALQSITISAAQSSISKGTTDQFSATGTFTDGTTQSLTNTATWSSSNTAAATITTGGLASGKAVGSSNIGASLSGISSNVIALTITAAALQSLTITSPGTSLPVGQTEQLTATGTFTDGSTQTMNSSVAWTSSNTATATIGTSGLLTAVAIGSTNASATNSGITSNLLAVAVISAIQHSVDVTWIASTSTVVGYNVYRGTQSGGPYTLVSTALVTGTAFTDLTVQAGQLYFYVVTSVDSSGTESVNSNEASAQVPTP
jgi:hypothetical protein